MKKSLLTVFSAIFIFAAAFLAVSCGGGGGGAIAATGGNNKGKHFGSGTESGSKIQLTSNQLFSGETASMMATTSYDFIRLKVSVNGIETIHQIQKGQNIELNIGTTIGDKLQMYAEICDASGTVLRTATSDPITIGLGKNDVVMYITYFATLHHADGTTTEYPFTSRGATLPVDGTTCNKYGYIFNSWATECDGSFDGTNGSGAFISSIAPGTRNDVELYANWVLAPVGLTPLQLQLTPDATKIENISENTYRYKSSLATASSSATVEVKDQIVFENAVNAKFPGSSVTYEYTSSNASFSVNSAGVVTTSNSAVGSTTITCRCKVNGTVVATASLSYTLKGYNPGAAPKIRVTKSGMSIAQDSYAVGDNFTYMFSGKNQSDTSMLLGAYTSWTVSITADASSGTAARTTPFTGNSVNKTMEELGIKDTYTGTMTVTLTYAIGGDASDVCIATQTIALTGASLTAPSLSLPPADSSGVDIFGNDINRTADTATLKFYGIKPSGMTTANITAWEWTFNVSVNGGASVPITRTGQNPVISLTTDFGITKDDNATVSASCKYTYGGKQSPASASRSYTINKLYGIDEAIAAIMNGTYNGESINGSITTAQWASLKNAINASTSNINLDLSGTTMTAVPASAFESVTKLVSIQLPSSVTSIGASAFKSCTGLSTFTVGANVTTIGNYAFANTSLTSVTFADTSKKWQIVADGILVFDPRTDTLNRLTETRTQYEWTKTDTPT